MTQLFYAGYKDGKIDKLVRVVHVGTSTYWATVPAIFFYKDDATKLYLDVREITL